MNNSYSRPELQYLPRWITPRLQSAVQEHRVVVLTGARQVGKSTLLRHAEPFSTWRYYSLDAFDVLRQAETDPTPLWAGLSHAIHLQCKAEIIGTDPIIDLGFRKASIIGSVILS